MSAPALELIRCDGCGQRCALDQADIDRFDVVLCPECAGEERADRALILDWLAEAPANDARGEVIDLRPRLEGRAR